MSKPANPRGAVSPGVSVAADKRFRRPDARPPARRSRPRSLAWRIARVAVGLAAAGALTAGVVTAAVKAPALRIASVTVRGNVHLTTAEVQALAAGLKGENILFARLEPIRQRVLDSPWVAAATLRRVLPSTVEIRVTERQPLAVARSGRQLFLIDAAGLVIDEYTSQYAAFDLPIVDGVLTMTPGGDPSVDAGRARFAARVLDAIDAAPGTRGRVSQLDVADAHDAVVLISGDAALLQLGESQFAERMQRYLEMAPTLRDKMSALDYVDLRFDDHVYVRPRAPVKAKQ